MKLINLNIEYSLKDKVGALGLDLEAEKRLYEQEVKQAFQSIQFLQQGSPSINGENVRFWHLAQESLKKLPQIKSWVQEVRGKFKNVVYIGIGGSYLGNRMLLDALGHPYQQLLNQQESPRAFFTGYNLDPIQIGGLFDIINIEETLFVVISKSGGTIEPMTHLAIVLQHLSENGLRYKDHIVSVTDDNKGSLREFSIQNKIKTWSVPDGVGGRFSVLSDAGLVLTELAGFATEELLQGAIDWSESTQNQSLEDNPSALYAFIHYLFDQSQQRDISVLMPYSSSLKSLSEWYVQLLSESLGKKKKNGKGEWEYYGQTPLCAVGTTDMHSQTQQHIHGKQDKLITFIEVNDFADKEIKVPSMLSGDKAFFHQENQTVGNLLNVALEANRLSLAGEGRPTLTLTLPEITPYYLGQIIYFFEYAIAFGGALYEIDAFDQPGVEAYKKIMKDRLNS